MTPANVDLASVEKEDERERRGVGLFWRFGPRGSAAAPWTARLGALGRSFTASLGGAFEAPQTLVLLLGAAAMGAGYFVVASWVDGRDEAAFSRGRLTQDFPLTPPSAMARAKGTYAGSLELLASANRGGSSADDQGEPRLPRERRTKAPPPPPAPPLPVPAAVAAVAAPGEPARDAAGADAGAFGRLSGSSGGGSGSTFWPGVLGGSASAAAKTPGARPGGRSSISRPSGGGSEGRTTRPVPSRGGRGALSQLQRANALSRFAATTASEPSRFAAGQAFEGSTGAGAPQPITGGGAALGEAVGPEVGGGRPLGGDAGTRSVSGSPKVVDPTRDTRVDCALAANRELATCAKIKETEIPLPVEGSLAAARKIFWAVLGLFALALLLRLVKAPWALAASRAAAALAGVGAAAMMALGIHAMTESGGDQGWPWVLAGGVLLPLALKLVKGEPDPEVVFGSDVERVVSEPVGEFADDERGKLVVSL